MAGLRMRRAIGVLDINARIRQLSGNLGEGARLIVVRQQQHLVFDDQSSPLFEQRQSALRFVYDHSQNRMVDGVAHRERQNINFGVCEGLADPGKCAGFVVEKQRKLSGELHDGVPQVGEGLNAKVKPSLGLNQAWPKPKSQTKPPMGASLTFLARQRGSGLWP